MPPNPFASAFDVRNSAKNPPGFIPRTSSRTEGGKRRGLPVSHGPPAASAAANGNSSRNRRGATRFPSADERVGLTSPEAIRTLAGMGSDLKTEASPPRRIYWGDSHHNCYTSQVQIPPVSEVLAFAATHLDFYAGAYYTPRMSPAPIRANRVGSAPPAEEGHPAEMAAWRTQPWRGIFLEQIKAPEVLAREWAEFQEAIRGAHAPGRFVAFPGYEWQGDGTWGDHNVVHLRDGGTIHGVETLPELYAKLRSEDAIAIPHHIGYHAGIRAPRWEFCDETISPFAEIFSKHGGSETDEELIGLRQNSHMGPGTAAGAWQAALDRGLHLGAIASTDNWSNMPGSWGEGLMACSAEDLTREALWEAFRARRVYGVTGDRIELEFTANGAPMGSRLPRARVRRLRARVRGQDEIDRIELLRNGRVIATHNHQGIWRTPSGSAPTRWKLRIETGWGPRLGELPFLHQDWEGTASLERGRFTGWSPCWITRGQRVPQLNGATAAFRMRSHQNWIHARSQGATIFEFEAAPDAEFSLKLNGMTVRGRVAELAAQSRICWFRDEALARIRDFVGLEEKDLPRVDPIVYHYAFKAKLHRAIPEAAFAAEMAFEDDAPIEENVHYRVRVEQRNGQRAWSSPIWFEDLRAEAVTTL